MNSFASQQEYSSSTSWISMLSSSTAIFLGGYGFASILNIMLLNSTTSIIIKKIFLLMIIDACFSYAGTIQ